MVIQNFTNYFCSTNEHLLFNFHLYLLTMVWSNKVTPLSIFFYRSSSILELNIWGVNRVSEMVACVSSREKQPEIARKKLTYHVVTCHELYFPRFSGLFIIQFVLRYVNVFVVFCYVRKKLFLYQIFSKT